MSPSNLEGCWHAHCLLTTVHGHDIEPERCEDCISLEPANERAANLRARAARIAALKHHPQNEREKH